MPRAMSSRVPSDLQLGRCLTAHELGAIKVWTPHINQNPWRVEGEDGSQTLGKPEAQCTMWD